MGGEMLSTPPGDRSDPASLLAMSTFHEFEMTSITGEQVSFDQFRGQICLIVNVASA
jgi:hypothetical protein